MIALKVTDFPSSLLHACCCSVHWNETYKSFYLFGL